MPEPRNLHIDAVLSNLSVKYRNEAMIWPLAMPQIKVGKRSDKFYVYNKADSYKLPEDKLGPKSMPNEMDWGVSDSNYSVKDHGLADWIPQEEMDNADNPLQPEADTNEFLNNLLDVAQEQRVAAIVFAAATYPTGNKVQLSGTGQWGQSADDPLKNVLDAIESCFVRANTLIFGAEAWQVFRRLPEVLDAVKGTVGVAPRGGLASASEIATLFEVGQVLVGRGRYITSKEGQTPTYARLWGKHCAALHVEKNPGVRSITFGLTFSEMLRQTQRDFDVRRGAKGAHYIKVAWNSDEKVIASDLGYFIQDAVA